MPYYRLRFIKCVSNLRGWALEIELLIWNASCICDILYAQTRTHKQNKYAF